tara:strand:+ start:144 stop:506 length:363 start_codon:yes stop_codon:yes gene_type:complete
MKLTIQEVLADAELELRERIEFAVNEEEYSYDDDDGEYIDDILHEVADNNIPIYYTQLLEVCMSDISMATETPEIGECDNAISCIQANIYQEIYDMLHEAKYELYEAIEEESNQKEKDDE